MSETSSSRALIPALAVVVLVVVAVIGWYALQPEPVTPDEVEVFAPPVDPGKTVVAPEIDVSANPEKTRVEVEFERLARVLPDWPMRPTCALVVNLDAGEVGVPGEWVAGLAALPIAKSFQGQQLVRFRLGGGQDHYRVTRLRARDHGRVELPRGMAKDTRGKIVAANGKPIEGADVWLAGQRTVTDDKGEFRITAMPADSGLPFVVRKAGFAAHYRVLSGAQYDALDSRPVTLREGAVLHVKFHATEADPDARYFLLPAGGRDSRLLEFPFFLQAIEDGFEVREGMVVFQNLPKGVRVRVRVLHRGFAPATSEEIRMTDGMVAVVVRGRPVEQVRGVAVAGRGNGTGGGNGAPFAGAWLTSRAADSGLSLSAVGWLLAPLAYVANGHVTRSGKTGEFRLARLVGGDAGTAITVQAPGRTGLEFTRRADDAAVLRAPLHPRVDHKAPGLVLRAGPKLLGTGAARVLLTVRDEKGLNGPYGWNIAEPFALRLGSRSLLRVRIQIGEDTTVRDVPATGGTEVVVGR